MKKGSLVMVKVMLFCLLALPAWAATYVSDNLEAPVRNGPGTQHRIIGAVQSGLPVEVLSEREGWSHIRYATTRGDREGWVLTRYLMSRQPWEVQVRSLETENLRLKETASPMAKELRDLKTMNAELESLLAEKTGELETLQTAYEALLDSASGFLELQDEYEAMQADYARIEQALAGIMAEKEHLRSTDSQKWFATGAVVLLVGLLMGMILGRREKKRSSRIY